MVEELGHRVVAEAGDVEIGCELAEIASFDLALLDINIDGASITPVAEAIEKRGLPFLFVSGYGSRCMSRRFRSLRTQKTVSLKLVRSHLSACAIRSQSRSWEGALRSLDRW
jgi:hypothetical protein